MHLVISKIAVVLTALYLIITSVEAGYGSYGDYKTYGNSYGGSYGQMQMSPAYYYYKPQANKKSDIKKAAIGILAGLTGGLLLLGGLVPAMTMGAAGLLLPGGAGLLGGGALGGGLLGGGLGPGGFAIGKRSITDDKTRQQKQQRTKLELYEKTLENLRHQLTSVQTSRDCFELLKVCNRELKRWIDQGFSTALVNEENANNILIKSTMQVSPFSLNNNQPSKGKRGGQNKGEEGQTMTKEPQIDTVWCKHLLPQCSQYFNNPVLSSASASPKANHRSSSLKQKYSTT